MKKLLLLVFFFSISLVHINAQEINLQNLSTEQRKNYVIQEATRALDVFLYKLIKDLVDINAPEPTYVVSNYYSEIQLNTDEEIDDFNYLYKKFITDYTVVKNDYLYVARFTKSGLSGEDIAYAVSVLNNGKALDMFIIEKGVGRAIYNATE